MNTGRIVQVVGPVIDIEFPPKSMPAILNAIHIDGTTDDGKVKIHLTAEVMQHIGYNVVRAVAMSSTDDNTDSHVHYIALESERFEFFN